MSIPIQNVRISQSHRDRIRKKLLEEKFTARLANLEEDKTKLAMRVYEKAFDKQTREKMESLPEGWLPVVKNIKARLNGCDVCLSLEKEVRVPDEKHGGSYNSESTFLLNELPGTPLSKTWKSINEECDAITEEREKLRSDINSVLYSVSRSNKLIEIWPEIKTIVEEVCSIAVINLPAPRIVDLNKALGLK